VAVAQNEQPHIDDCQGCIQASHAAGGFDLHAWLTQPA
jgi:hypothetical protein